MLGLSRRALCGPSCPSTPATALDALPEVPQASRASSSPQNRARLAVMGCGAFKEQPGAAVN